MGNYCATSFKHHQHIRVRDGGPYKFNKRKYKSKGLKFDENVFDVQDEKVQGSPLNGRISTNAEEDDADRTLPLTPSESMISMSSTTSWANSEGYSSSLKGVDDSGGADKPCMSACSSKNDSPSTCAASSSTCSQRSKKPGRALEQRLKRAHYMKMIMKLPMEDLSSDFFGLSSLSKSRNDGIETPRTFDFAGGNKLSNTDFEANLLDGMIWAEIDAGSQVLAMVLSQPDRTIDHNATPLLLALGTSEGNIKVTEILNYDNGPRLGVTMNVQRKWRIRAIDFLPGGGSCFACGGDEGVCALIRLHENGSVKVLSEIKRLDRIYAAKFSPDAQYLAIGGYDEAVAIADVTSLTAPRIVAEIRCLGLISTLAWSSDCQFLAIGGSDKVCSVVSQSSGWRVVHEIRRPAAISSVQWHPQKKSGMYRLAIGSSDIFVVEKNFMECHSPVSNDYVDLTFIPSPSRKARNGRIHDLCWSPDDIGLMVVCDSNRDAVLIETTTFSTIQEISQSEKVNCVLWGAGFVATRTDEIPQSCIAIGGDDGKVVILKAQAPQVQGMKDNNALSDNISRHVPSIEWTLQDDPFDEIVKTPHNFFEKIEHDEWATSEHDFCHGQGSTCSIVSSASFPEKCQDFQAVRSIEFSRGDKDQPSKFFASASSDGFVTVRAVDDFKVLCQLEFLDPITCIAFTNGSKFMACGSNDGKVRVVATEPVWTMVTVIDVMTPVVELMFSKNNERLAILGHNGVLSLADPQAQFSKTGVLEENSMISVIDWSWKHLATGRDDGTVSIYKVDTVCRNSDSFSLEQTLSSSCPVRALSFEPNARHLVVGGDDGVLSVFSSAGDWAMVHRICFDFGISSLKWSPSCRHLVVAGASQNQLKVYDTAFWANVDEVERAFFISDKSRLRDETIEEDNDQSESRKRRKNQKALLSLSQDGKLLGYADQNNGFRLINTLSWDVAYDINHPSSRASSDKITSSTFVDWDVSYLTCHPDNSEKSQRRLRLQ